MTEQAISPLRRRMIEDMAIRKFAQKPAAAQLAPMLPSPPNSPTGLHATPAPTSKEGIAPDLFPHPHGSTDPRG
jgi:hypothetical protein